MEKVKQDWMKNWWKNCVKNPAWTEAWRLYLVYQEVLDLLHASTELVCVLEPRVTERKLATSRWSGCILYFQLIWYSSMSLSHKVTLTLLCNSLIICISWHWIYFATFTLVGLCCLGLDFMRAPERTGNNKDLRKRYKGMSLIPPY